MSDFFIDFKYRMEDEKPYGLTTNIKPERLKEVLSDYLRSQMGAGEDHSEYTERKEYHIKIELDLDGDIFKTSSDTGNKNLTAGIVMDSINELERLAHSG